jgi:hypothetical protein
VAFLTLEEQPKKGRCFESFHKYGDVMAVKLTILQLKIVF